MKICSLLPSGTEILFALGLGKNVIGLTDLCAYPPEAKGKRVVCWSRLDPSQLTSAEVEERMQDILTQGESPFILDLAWLRSAQPDLVLTQNQCYRCCPDADDVTNICSALHPSTQVLVLSPRTLPDIFENIYTVGKTTGVFERAGILVGELRGRVDKVAAKAASSSYRPRVFSLEGVNPLVAGGHWLPELKMLAGGQDDLFEPGGPAQRIRWETVRNYAPEVLLIDLCSSDIRRSLREVAWLAKQEGWWELPAVERGEVYILEHAYYSTPGPRVIDGLEIMTQILHPELFTGMIPANSVVKLDKSAAKSRPDEIACCFAPYP